MTKILAAMAAALMLAGCATAALQPPVQITVTAPESQPGMTVGSTVSVTAANLGRSTVANIAINCQFLDAAGLVVNTGATFFTSLAPGASDTNVLLPLTPNIVRAVCTLAGPREGAAR